MHLVEKELRVLLAQARCRGLGKEDVIKLVDQIYDEYENGFGDNVR